MAEVRISFELIPPWTDWCMVSRNVIGLKVKEARLINQITQEQLATRLQILGWDIDRFGVSKIERKQREVIDKEVLLLAKALKVSITQLLVEDQES